MKRKNLICYWNFHFEGKTEAQRNSVDSQGFDILDVISKSEKNHNTKWVYKKIRNTCVVQLDAKYN